MAIAQIALRPCGRPEIVGGMKTKTKTGLRVYEMKNRRSTITVEYRKQFTEGCLLLGCSNTRPTLLIIYSPDPTTH